MVSWPDDDQDHVEVIKVPWFGGDIPDATMRRMRAADDAVERVFPGTAARYERAFIEGDQ